MEALNDLDRYSNDPGTFAKAFQRLSPHGLDRTVPRRYHSATPWAAPRQMEIFRRIRSYDIKARIIQEPEQRIRKTELLVGNMVEVKI